MLHPEAMYAAEERERSLSGLFLGSNEAPQTCRPKCTIEECMLPCWGGSKQGLASHTPFPLSLFSSMRQGCLPVSYMKEPESFSQRLAISRALEELSSTVILLSYHFLPVPEKCVSACQHSWKAWGLELFLPSYTPHTAPSRLLHTSIDS